MTAQVLPLHIPQSTTLNRPFQQHHMAPDTSPSDHSHPATASPRGAPQPDSPEASRGRRRTRTSEDGGDDGDQSATEMGQGPGRKRRRSRKGLDKKFECPHEGCGKSYSRAEHLYRHQLNRESLPLCFGCASVSWNEFPRLVFASFSVYPFPYSRTLPKFWVGL